MGLRNFILTILDIRALITKFRTKWEDISEKLLHLLYSIFYFTFGKLHMLLDKTVMVKHNITVKSYRREKLGLTLFSLDHVKRVYYQK